MPSREENEMADGLYEMDVRTAIFEELGKAVGLKSVG